jgi:hypothetical protein
LVNIGNNKWIFNPQVYSYASNIIDNI